MIKHKEIYCNFFGYATGDSIPCEVCKHEFMKNNDGVIHEAVDIHHLAPRAMGGATGNTIRETKNYKDYPENLMALCRRHHMECEDRSVFNKLCRIIHLKYIIKHLEENI
tara:strand:- start:457 stop:786 length:330 start_codon:yes stop_codon:yes gene_type:complete